jgi:hypothetical protein
MDLRGWGNKKKAVTKAYRRLFDSEDGTMVLEDMCKMCNFNASTFSNDPLEMAFNEGKRSIILRIMRVLKSDPTELFKLIEDNQKE